MPEETAWILPSLSIRLLIKKMREARGDLLMCSTYNHVTSPSLDHYVAMLTAQHLSYKGAARGSGDLY